MGALDELQPMFLIGVKARATARAKGCLPDSIVYRDVVFMGRSRFDCLLYLSTLFLGLE